MLSTVFDLDCGSGAPQVQGAGVGGSNATCIDVRPQGGLFFVSRSAERPGYRPFLDQNATTLSFYVKRTSAADIGRGSGIPLVCMCPLETQVGNTIAKA